MTLTNLTYIQPLADAVNDPNYNQTVAAWLQAHPGFYLWDNSSMFWYTVVVMLSSAGVVFLVMKYGDRILSHWGIFNDH